MKKIILIINLVLLVHLVAFGNNSTAINSARPKIGLTLSGGGAKGLIYVGLLKLIDSLEIKVDYITGTSMGAIVGGLYAIGYNGNTLDSIARNTKWDKYLTNSVPLNKITIEEKNEYGRYMIELNSNSLTPDLPIAIINGQNILEFLNDLTFRVHHISDFNKLPIPFKCVAVDIVTGKPVLLDKGSLALALRTSMAIPTAFSPIENGDMLLVDGGLFKNFPVEYVKQMGADFVIGANSSGMLLSKKELKSLVDMLSQVTSFSIAADYEKQKLLCDILLDYNDVLKNAKIGTLDFSKTKEILALGEQVAHNYLEPLKQLAESQKKYKLAGIDSSDLNISDSLILDDVTFSLDKSKLETIIRNKIRLKDYNNISKTAINKIIDDIYGTRYFESAYYYVKNENNQHQLNIQTEKTKKFHYKLGLHYDNEMSAGIIANITARNVLLDASRFLFSIDISDNPKLRTNYQIYVGDKGLYINTNHFFEYVKQPVFFQENSVGNYRNLFWQSDVFLNYAIQQNSSVSAGLQFKWNNLKPISKSFDQPFIDNSFLSLSKRPMLNTAFILKYHYNTINKPIFANKGVNLLVQPEFVFAGKSTTKLNIETISLDTAANIQFNDRDSTIKNKFSPYLRLYAKYEHVFKLHKKVALIGNIDIGLTILTKPKNNSLNFERTDAYYLGGPESRERERVSSLIPFWGTRDLYVQNLNFLTASVSLQYEVIKNLFIIPKVSIYTGDNAKMEVYNNKAIINNLKGQLAFAHSEGGTIAYKTPIGPVSINVSKSSNSKRPTFYFSLGYRF